MSARHLENLLVFQQAERCVVVTSYLPHPVARQGILKLELEDSLSVGILANFAMKFRASKVEQSMGGDQNRVV